MIATPFEKDLRVCEIVLNDEYLCEVSTYYDLKGKIIETNYRNMKIKCNIYQTKFEIYDKDNFLVCEIYKPFAESKYKETYVLLYNDKKFEREFLLFTLALEKLCYED